MKTEQASRVHWMYSYVSMCHGEKNSALFSIKNKEKRSKATHTDHFVFLQCSSCIRHLTLTKPSSYLPCGHRTVCCYGNLYLPISSFCSLVMSRHLCACVYFWKSYPVPLYNHSVCVSRICMNAVMWHWYYFDLQLLFNLGYCLHVSVTVLRLY